ncbi:MAG: PDDEXK nuclease domain-containing protein [Candidatus Gastranaerophilaceae bacterium]|jgi:predicted nuclease of restriction endonuclease-like (RecB) superfamily
MSNNDLEKYSGLFDRISSIIEQSRQRIVTSVNTEMVHCYWAIGKEIIEEEQKGRERAEYGKAIIDNLSNNLIDRFGKGYSKRNLWSFRQFYLTYQNVNALRAELSWTHYRSLIRIDEGNKRSFYEIECIKNNWSTRELERQINSLLFERLALSRDKAGVLELATKGQSLLTPADLVKDPYVLEFLGLKETEKLYENSLESALIEHLQHFMLELGKGFTFVARQKRITLDGSHFYIDLVFYNYLLKCFVIIDLKTGELTHQDIGQMQMYVNFYHRELTPEGDNPPIGIVLCADKKDAVVKYTLPEDNKQIFASRYKLYLPTEEELKQELIKEKELIELYKTQQE